MSVPAIVHCATLLSEIDQLAKKNAELLLLARPKLHQPAIVHVVNNGRPPANLTINDSQPFEPALTAPIDTDEHTGIRLLSTLHQFILSRHGVVLLQWLPDHPFATPVVPRTAAVVALFCSVTELQTVRHELAQLQMELEQSATIMP